MKKAGFEILEHWTGVNSLPLAKGDFRGKETYLFDCVAFVRIHNAKHPDPGYMRPMLRSGGLSQEVNAFKGDVVFNNVNIEDLSMDSQKQACRGSREKSPAFMMGFVECCSPSNGIVVDLNILTGALQRSRSPTSFLLARPRPTQRCYQRHIGSNAHRGII